MKGRVKLALGLLVVLHLPVIFAEFLAPYNPITQHRAHAYAPPNRLHFIDSHGRFHLRPFVYRLHEESYGHYVEDRTQAYPLSFFVRVEQDQPSTTEPGDRLTLLAVEQPATLFLLGTDEFGRDVYSRLLFGGQVSLLAGLVATLLSVSLGLLLGGLSGYVGGRLDEWLMRLTEVFLALPWLYLLLAVRAFLPLHLSQGQTFLLLVVMIGVVGWAAPARLIRGVVMSARERDYVRAARGFGASHLYLLRRHVLPAAFGVAWTQATLLIPRYILAEVTMSFLGLGVGEPTASWGGMLACLQQYHVALSAWWMLSPGIVLVLVVLCYHHLANSLSGVRGVGEG